MCVGADGLSCECGGICWRCYCRSSRFCLLLLHGRLLFANSFAYSPHLWLLCPFTYEKKHTRLLIITSDIFSQKPYLRLFFIVGVVGCSLPPVYLEHLMKIEHGSIPYRPLAIAHIHPAIRNSSTNHTKTSSPIGDHEPIDN